jgi:hypothetical protein
VVEGSRWELVPTRDEPSADEGQVRMTGEVLHEPSSFIIAATHYSVGWLIVGISMCAVVLAVTIVNILDMYPTEDRRGRLADGSGHQQPEHSSRAQVAYQPERQDMLEWAVQERGHSLGCPLDELGRLDKNCPRCGELADLGNQPTTKRRH